MQIVVDTNVIFSGIFFHGQPGNILESVLANEYHIVLSEEIISEYKNVIIRYCKKKKIQDFSVPLKIIDILTSKSLLINPDRIVTPFCADPDDIKFLQAAIAGKAKYLISGDKHLIEVNEYQGGRVIKAQEFCRLMPNLP